jgi:hypothetical protein
MDTEDRGMTPGFEVTETFHVDSQPGTAVVGRLLGGAIARHGDVLVDGTFRARIENVGILGTVDGAPRVQLVVDIPAGGDLQPGQLLAIESPTY